MSIIVKSKKAFFLHSFCKLFFSVFSIWTAKKKIVHIFHKNPPTRQSKIYKSLLGSKGLRLEKLMHRHEYDMGSRFSTRTEHETNS